MTKEWTKFRKTLDSDEGATLHGELLTVSRDGDNQALFRKVRIKTDWGVFWLGSKLVNPCIKVTK